MTFAEPPEGPQDPLRSGHLSAVVVDRFVNGAVGPAACSAVELHLERCGPCRQAVNSTATALDADRTRDNWRAVVAELDAPRRSILERTMVRLGMAPDTVRLMGATPALRRSWFLAIFIALLFAAAAANPDRPDATLIWLLALAPLIPVLGVALAYGPGVDPSYEITVAAAMSGFRLVLVRATAVLVTSLVVGGAVSLLMLRRHDAMVMAWLLPALALSLVCLALMTVLDSRVAAAVVSGAWLVVVVALSANAADQLVVFRGPGQVVFAAVAVLGAAALLLRRRTFDTAAHGARS